MKRIGLLSHSERIYKIANPYHHSISSVKKWGGEIEDYIAIHEWFDESKKYMSDFRHRALRHHTAGIYECQAHFGHWIRLSTGKIIPVRWIGEQHVTEDCGRIPSVQDWFENIEPKPWMNTPRKLSKELDAQQSS